MSSPAAPTPIPCPRCSEPMVKQRTITELVYICPDKDVCKKELRFPIRQGGANETRTRKRR